MNDNLNMMICVCLGSFYLGCNLNMMVNECLGSFCLE